LTVPNFLSYHGWIKGKDSLTFVKNITDDIELIHIQDVNRAYERLLKGDVHYRFVIDMASLKD
jgi:Zn-dependent alcohol dehydrogenases